ncbi:hypothetical protein LXL04_002475 [Taraxacum kok-saghyz]
MDEKCFIFLLSFVFLFGTTVNAASFSVGGGVGVGVGVGVGGSGGGGWLGGGVNYPNPSVRPPSNLNNAYIALQAWKTAIKSDPKGLLRSWVGSNVCAYHGVFCADPSEETGDPSGPVVAGIDLNHGNLEGILVKELSLLTDMSLLHLNSNRFTGTIPQSFRDLYGLIELDLSNNQFTGPFPAATLQIPNLLYLDLRFNSFSGQIPQDLFSKNLDAIFLNNNQFDGEIPQTLGNSPASVINLANNKLTGDIPVNFGYTSPKLKEILFMNNRLTGCIPQGIGMWSDMQVFDASFNALMGHLPDTVSCLEDIEVLNVAHNKLSGELPDLVCELRSLLKLSVAYNFFSGFSQECEKLYGRNVGFEIDLNCIPGLEMQRPQPECSLIPGSESYAALVNEASPIRWGWILKVPTCLNQSFYYKRKTECTRENYGSGRNTAVGVLREEKGGNDFIYSKIGSRFSPDYLSPPNTGSTKISFPYQSHVVIILNQPILGFFIFTYRRFEVKQRPTVGLRQWRINSNKALSPQINLILKSRLEPEATEKFPNNMEISEWRPRFDGIFGISSLEEEGDMKAKMENINEQKTIWFFIHAISHMVISDKDKTEFSREAVQRYS